MMFIAILIICLSEYGVFAAFSKIMRPLICVKKVINGYVSV